MYPPFPLPLQLHLPPQPPPPTGDDGIDHKLEGSSLRIRGY